MTSKHVAGGQAGTNPWDLSPSNFPRVQGTIARPSLQDGVNVIEQMAALSSIFPSPVAASAPPPASAAAPLTGSRFTFENTASAGDQAETLSQPNTETLSQSNTENMTMRTGTSTKDADEDEDEDGEGDTFKSMDSPQSTIDGFCGLNTPLSQSDVISESSHNRGASDSAVTGTISSLMSNRRNTPSPASKKVPMKPKSVNRNNAISATMHMQVPTNDWQQSPPQPTRRNIAHMRHQSVDYSVLSQGSQRSSMVGTPASVSRVSSQDSPERNGVSAASRPRINSVYSLSRADQDEVDGILGQDDNPNIDKAIEIAMGRSSLKRKSQPRDSAMPRPSEIPMVDMQGDSRASVLQLTLPSSRLLDFSPAPATSSSLSSSAVTGQKMGPTIPQSDPYAYESEVLDFALPAYLMRFITEPVTTSSATSSSLSSSSAYNVFESTLTQSDDLPFSQDLKGFPDSDFGSQSSASLTADSGATSLSTVSSNYASSSAFVGTLNQLGPLAVHEAVSSQASASATADSVGTTTLSTVSSNYDSSSAFVGTVIKPDAQGHVAIVSHASASAMAGSTVSSSMLLKSEQFTDKMLGLAPVVPRTTTKKVVTKSTFDTDSPVQKKIDKLCRETEFRAKLKGAVIFFSKKPNSLLKERFIRDINEGRVAKVDPTNSSVKSFVKVLSEVELRYYPNESIKDFAKHFNIEGNETFLKLCLQDAFLYEVLLKLSAPNKFSYYESMLFLSDVKEFKRCLFQKSRREIFDKIMKKYIGDGSSCQININAHSVLRLQADSQRKDLKLTKDYFQEEELCVLKLIVNGMLGQTHPQVEFALRELVNRFLA